MQKCPNIGNITFRKDSVRLEASSLPRNWVLYLDVSYLSIEGLGGLGRAMALWMVEKGVRHLSFISRSARSVTGEKP